MNYLIISFSHKNIDIQGREKLSFPNEENKDKFLKQLLEQKSIEEAILLSTCNRVEVIVLSSNISYSKEFIIEKLAQYSNLNFEDLFQRAGIYDGSLAVHHLFSVACALDSLVIGETQIVGQLKDAFRLSMSKNYCQQGLSRLFHYAFKCAAVVRSETNLGSGSVSVASTAVLKAKEVIGDKKGVKALVIGAGQMSELLVNHLISKEFEVLLISRDIKKATLLSQAFSSKIEVQPYENLQSLLNEVPFIFTATSAPYPIIKKEMVKECKFNRFWFDIAVPRDIDEIKIANLNIFTIDDLRFIVGTNLEIKAKQAKIAFKIVGKMSKEFFSWLKTLGIEPIIKNLYLRGDEIIDKKLKNAIKKGFIDKKEEKNVRKLCETILTEYLHQPSKKIKQMSKNMECDVVLGSLQGIFEFKSDLNMINKYKCEYELKINERG